MKVAAESISATLRILHQWNPQDLRGNASGWDAEKAGGMA